MENVQSEIKIIALEREQSSPVKNVLILLGVCQDMNLIYECSTNNNAKECPTRSIIGPIIQHTHILIVFVYQMNCLVFF